MEERVLQVDEYCCEMCKEVFKKGRSDEEALEETAANGWGDVPPEGLAVICED